MYRWIVVGLALAAAATFALSVQAGCWWSIGPVEIGPTGTRHCPGGAEHCTLGWMNADPRWLRIGVGTYASGLISTLVLVVLAAGTAAKRTPRLVAKVTIASIVTAIVTGTLFVIGFPALAGSHLDRGVWLFGIGVGFGLAAAITVLRTPKT